MGGNPTFPMQGPILWLYLRDSLIMLTRHHGEDSPKPTGHWALPKCSGWWPQISPQNRFFSYCCYTVNWIGPSPDLQSIKIPGDLHKYQSCSKIQQQLLVTLSVVHETYIYITYNIHTYNMYIICLHTHFCYKLYNLNLPAPDKVYSKTVYQSTII